MNLTRSQREQYREQGCLVVEGAISDGEISALRDVAEDWVAQSRNVTSNDELFDLEPAHRPEAPAVRRVKSPHLASRIFASLAVHSGILSVISDLIGINVRLRATKLNMKSAGVGSSVEWHQDWAFYPHTNDDLLAVGVPLDDMTPENGCLLIVPGSHRGPVLDHRSSSGVFVGSVDPQTIDGASIEPVIAPAGAITVHHARLLHGSAPNSSGKMRRLFLAEYCAADAWPLTDTDWAAYASQIVSGVPTSEPRLEAVPVRLPFPAPDSLDTIYEFQESAPERRYTFSRPSQPGSNAD
jgi:phytanoyl-CoA hydroxylase